MLKWDCDFDKKLIQDELSGMTIFPVICFDDFHFTMPGINEYLNKSFRQLLTREVSGKVDIRPQRRLAVLMEPPSLLKTE